MRYVRTDTGKQYYGQDLSTIAKNNVCVYTHAFTHIHMYVHRVDVCLEGGD